MISAVLTVVAWSALLLVLYGVHFDVRRWWERRQQRRRDREECARMESLRRMADWEWTTEAWRWDWAQADWRRYVRSLPEAPEREVAR